MNYDVIIAGGSFAGLAVAAQLRGRRVLLVEPHPIGAVETSACGTLLSVLEATGTMDSLLQVHDRLVLHLGNRTTEYALPYSFCTFDYHTFCERLLNQNDAEILPASVLGHAGHQVYTSQGTFEAQVLIDATGWRAALATQAQRKSEPHRGKSFGIETVIPVSATGLHFYYDPRVYRRFNVGWLFPVGAGSRAGFGSYQGQTRLNEGLARFVEGQFGCQPGGRYGGYFPYASQPSTTGNVFRVGDAGGQCIPFTGEGIRPALSFGAYLGRLAEQVLAGEVSETEALRRYRRFVANQRSIYQDMGAAQKLLPRLPMPWLQAIAGLIQASDWINPIMELYWRAIDPATLNGFGKAGRLHQEQPSNAVPLAFVHAHEIARKADQ